MEYSFLKSHEMRKIRAQKMLEGALIGSPYFFVSPA